MESQSVQTLGRLLILTGALLLLAGGLVLLANRIGLPLGRLPGDVAIRGKHFAFYAPIATCLLISVLLTLLMWLVNHFRR
jgi:ribose/xylose/arabinose/galactoside ABC-type transport system permease subunit